jgi:hypothetical protein
MICAVQTRCAEISMPNVAPSVMFHFCCPLCGSEPTEVRFSSFLSGWRSTGKNRVHSLVLHLYIATWEVRFGLSRWRTKSFDKKADELICTIFANRAELAFTANAFFTRISPERLECSTDCPLCEYSAGPRKADSNFKPWNEANKVQVANLYFEVGLLLSSLSEAPPDWLLGDLPAYFSEISTAMDHAAKATELLSCPRCGRFANSLFGATKEQPELGRCRWCLDSEGSRQFL